MIVSQPGVNLIDYWGRIQVPHLRRMINGDVKNIRSSMMVQHVAGNLELERFRHVTQDTCGARLLRIDASSKSLSLRDCCLERYLLTASFLQSRLICHK